MSARFPTVPRFSVARLSATACYVCDLAPRSPLADRVAYCEASARFALRAARLAPEANANEVASLAESRAKAARRCRDFRKGWGSPSRCLSTIPDPTEQRRILRGWIARYGAATLAPLPR